MSVLSILLFLLPDLLKTGGAAPRTVFALELYPEAGRSAPVAQAEFVAPMLDLVREQSMVSFRREMLLLAHASTQRSAPSSCARGSHPYVVVAGDTLSAVAARSGTTWMALASFNHLPDPNLLQVNQVLCIPDSGVPPASVDLHPQPPGWASGASTAAAPYGPPPLVTVEERDLTQQLFALINQDRAVRSLYPFAWNATLAGGARLHAWNMYHCGFSHSCPDGLAPCQRIAAEGIRYSDCGENIAYAGPYPTAWAGVYKIQESMIEEPPTGWHRIHLTSTTLQRIGIGVYVDPTGYIWFVEDMAS